MFKDDSENSFATAESARFTATLTTFCENFFDRYDDILSSLNWMEENNAETEVWF